MVKNTVLVTGATGGLGRIVVERLLAEGRDVIASGRNREVGERLGTRFLPADLARDDLAPLLANVGTVMHLAALSAPFGPYETFLAANILATQRLLASARASGVARFVFVSTPSIYARPADQTGITEATPLPPRLANAYAETKLAAECAVLAAHGQAMATIALRPRAILTPYDTALLPRLLRAADKGVMLLPAGGRALVEPTDARDVAEALLAAETHAETAGGRAFNISGGAALSLRSMVGHVFSRLGRRVLLIPVPRRPLLWLGQALDRHARREPPITAYSAMILGWSQTFDLTGARQTLGWTTRHAPLASLDWALSCAR